MFSFSKANIKHKPNKIGNDKIENDLLTGSTQRIEADEVIVQKLLDHLNIINDYDERIKAIDYLLDNAEKLVNNLKYTTNDKSLIDDIKKMQGNGNIIDFELFKKAAYTVIQGYKEMALVSITGANNA